MAASSDSFFEMLLFDDVVDFLLEGTLFFVDFSFFFFSKVFSASDH